MTVSIHLPHLKEHAVCVGMLLKNVTGRHQGVIRKPIVTVKHTHILPRGTLQRHIAGMCLSTVPLQMNHLDARVTGRILVKNPRGGVGGAIIDTDDLKVLPRLT